MIEISKKGWTVEISHFYETKQKWNFFQLRKTTCAKSYMERNKCFGTEVASFSSLFTLSSNTNGYLFSFLSSLSLWNIITYKFLFLLSLLWRLVLKKEKSFVGEKRSNGGSGNLFSFLKLQDIPPLSLGNCCCFSCLLLVIAAAFHALPSLPPPPPSHLGFFWWSSALDCEL